MATRTFKHVLIGITGGIAAYKSLSLIRLFKKAGYEVKVVATTNALHFVTPLSIETLSENQLYVHHFDAQYPRSIDHISLVNWADIIIVAPATANIIAKYAHGIADDLLSTLLIASQKPTFIAPAMNDKMFLHTATQENLTILQKRGVYMLFPVEGALACGTEGVGKMQEPEAIFEAVHLFFERSTTLSEKKVLITAGPTYEPIDPVRFIGNYSSGKMGFALAQVFAEWGAEVTLISGPSSLEINHSNVKRVDVTTAAEMHKEVLDYFPTSDITVMAAAVADYTPKKVETKKIKKQKANWELPLTPTIDILAEIGKIKSDKQVVVGFALETDHELENALLKLESKNADIIVLNSLNDEGAGFKTSTNQVTIITKEKKIIQGEKKDKYEVAKDIVRTITDYSIPKR